jgi:large subunit ribosomal protein L18
MRTKRKRKIIGTPERPRLVVYRSLKHIYGQIIDDTNHKVLIAFSNVGKNIPDVVKKSKNRTDASREVGKALAKKAVDKKIEQVVFDRNGYIFHGRVKSFAEGAREGGLKF